MKCQKCEKTDSLECNDCFHGRTPLIRHIAQLEAELTALKKKLLVLPRVAASANHIKKFVDRWDEENTLFIDSLKEASDFILAINKDVK